jgi:sucrose-6-phosphate hydrolase SacC (GH32 family)
MTVPRSLHLVETGDGYRLHSRPVQELEALRTASATLPTLGVEGEKDFTGLLGFPPSRADLELTFDLDRTTASRFGVVLSNGQGERYRIGYDAVAGRFFSDRREAGDHGFSEVFADRVHEAPRESSAPVLDMRLLLDVASMELFADGGATVMTEIFFPSSPFDRIALFAEGGEAVLAAGEAHALRAAAFTDGRE